MGNAGNHANSMLGRNLIMTYTAVGIDASKGKSTVSIIRPAGVVVKRPYNI